MGAHLGPTGGCRVHVVVHRVEGWSTWEERHVKGVRREEDVNPFMACLLQLVPSALPGHCGEPKVSGAGKTPRRISPSRPARPGR